MHVNISHRLVLERDPNGDTQGVPSRAATRPHSKGPKVECQWIKEKNEKPVLWPVRESIANLLKTRVWGLNGGEHPSSDIGSRQSSSMSVISDLNPLALACLLRVANESQRNYISRAETWLRRFTLCVSINVTRLLI